MDIGDYNDEIDAAVPASLADPETLNNKKKKSGGFQSMNLIYPIYKAILGKGFNVPTPIQRKTIPLILEGRDVIASSKTGSGKTGAYMIPVLNRLKGHSTIVGTRALILLPTRELALQTAAVFKQFAKFTDLVHAIIVGGHGFEGQYESLASNPDIIIATPGRLMQHLEETNLSLAKIEFLIVDECDHMLELGFEEQLRTIVRKVPNNRQTILLSATIPEQVSEFAKIGLKDYVFVRLDSEYSIPDTMKLHFFLTKSQTKISSLLYFLKEKHNLTEKTIIFAATRYHVDFLVALLKTFGISSVGIYGKMDQLSRKDLIWKFKRNECNILVVTDLAARGIDIPLVTNVINWDFPTKPKVFIHRSGRTARAGRIGTTYTFLSPEEVLYLADLKLYIGRNFSTDGDPNDYAIANYGQLPEYLLDTYEEAVKNVLDRDVEIEKMFELCNRAIKLFKRTRTPASKSSIKGAHALDQAAVHVLLKDVAHKPDMEKLLQKIRNYKPTQSYLEFKNESGEIEMNNSALKFLTQARKQSERFKSRKEQRIRDLANQNFGAESDDEINNIKEDVELDFEDDDDQEDETETLKKKAITKTPTSNLKKRSYANSGINGAQKMDTEKKVKRSQRDFRHPTQFMSYEKSKDNTFDKTKINEDDIVPFVVVDEVGDLRKKQKYVWDKKKRNYVQKQDGDNGKFKKRDKEDKFMQDGKSKDLFKKWAKKNQMGYQRVGEQENSDMTRKARDLFTHRKKKFGGPEGHDDDQGFSGPGGRKNLSNKFGKGGRGKSEQLKNPEQIMKMKKIQAKNKLLNMPKTKRTQVLNKRKAAAKAQGGPGGGRGGQSFRGGSSGRGGRGGSSGRGGSGGRGGKRGGRR